MTKTISVVIYQQDGQWVAQALNVDVSSFGETVDEAREAIREALELYFEGGADAQVPEIRGGRVEDLLV